MTDPTTMIASAASGVPYNYKYTGGYNDNQYQIPYTVPVHSPGAGIGEMANALVNGYLGYLQQSRQPTQLSGAVAQPNIFSALFGTQPPAATPAPSPSTDGGLY